MTGQGFEREDRVMLDVHRDQGVFRIRSVAGGDMYVDLRDLANAMVAFMPARVADRLDWHGWWWPLLLVTSAPAPATVVGQPHRDVARVGRDVEAGQVRLRHPTAWTLWRGYRQWLGQATCAEIIELTPDAATGAVAEVAWIQKGEE